MDEGKEVKEWYFEYEIHRNRPGLLGDIASLFGMLNINIEAINGVENERRGLLLQCDDEKKMSFIESLLKQIPNITVTAFRPLSMLDRLVIRHGRYISRDVTDRKTFRFTREELGLLVDFLGEICKREGNQLIGVRGMPRVGKTESTIAASVHANKRWIVISSTLLKQTMATTLAEDEYSPHHIYLIDSMVTWLRGSERHQSLVREILQMPATKIIEHPDIFVHETEYRWEDFDAIIEIRNHEGEEIKYNLLELKRNTTDF
ncbi:conserved hypothetical protein [[Clostridium] ultunense Esp]|uniref:DUF3388 domain-containing protein n=1 Tax=Thermicanus aegyptius TaxID=94009 RepID=UPI0002B70FF4|nr:DUF3388 domain-containing protein [Thermicanus aegyptius]CCQ98109.1 conserved hypothetical protein [[Clostridium] ultunense Esp]